jgi:hypothetical protein
MIYGFITIDLCSDYHYGSFTGDTGSAGNGYTMTGANHPNGDSGIFANDTDWKSSREFISASLVICTDKNK